METQTTYKLYYSIENFAGTDLRLIPEDKYNEDKHYMEQEYTAVIHNGQLYRAEKEVKAQFRKDRKEWLKNAFGYLN